MVIERWLQKGMAAAAKREGGSGGSKDVTFFLNGTKQTPREQED
jgi:hypothetical protein